jgi:hypothetical protein
LIAKDPTKISAAQKALAGLSRTELEKKLRHGYQKRHRVTVWLANYEFTRRGIPPIFRSLTPRGDFMVVESTLGLLRAEGKLSKLAARSAIVRELLDRSNMQHHRVLPVIVTAMTREQVKADLSQAKDSGAVVVTRNNLEEAFDVLLRFPDADSLFEQAIQSLREDTHLPRTLPS